MKRVVVCMCAWLMVACAIVHSGLTVAAESAAPAVRVGVTRGVHAQILDEVKRVAASRGFGIDVVEFDDASRIDAALADGRIDAASFEDAQQLAATRAQRYALTEVAPTVTLPMALYSRKLKNLNELQPGATVAIPADPRGMARSLVLLQNDTLVTLRERAGLRATLRDVTGNRLGLKSSRCAAIAFMLRSTRPRSSRSTATMPRVPGCSPHATASASRMRARRMRTC